jgi:hypothetical protein
MIVSCLSPTCLIYKANYNLNFDGYEGDILVLSPRLAYGNFYDMENKDKFVDVNGSLSTTDIEDIISETEIKKYTKFVLIGEINPA